MKYYCLYCGWNANIEHIDTAIGKCWLCKCCGLHGHCGDYDEPKLLPEDAHHDNESDYDFCLRIFGENK